MNLMVPLLIASEFVFNMPSSESEDGSSDEERCLIIVVAKKKYKRTPLRITNYLEQTVASYTAKEFQQHFRITTEGYEHLLRIIGPSLKRKDNIGRHTVDVEKQLLAVIWLLATPDSYRSVGERFNMGKSSLSVSFIRVIKALCDLAPTVITWPSGEEVAVVKEKFRRMAGLQNVIGAVDGTFINIKAPKEDPESYITRKCNYSMTLQAICDPVLKFTDVFVGYPGSVSDNRIFRNSDIYRHIRNNLLEYFPQDEFIIGDKAYPVLNWCIPPYINRGNITPAKRHFNTIVGKTRQTIERAFALLFGRFRRLKFLDMNRTDLIPCTVLAACVLHNICLDYTDLQQIENYIGEGMNYVDHNEGVQVEVNGDQDGIGKRDEICRLLFVPDN